ncbi:MAG: ABC transporter substrate-binding protein [Actinobacteria bacterium]|nr:ABC transporter substrate-binding protein [Actinomycetota bacterium]
MNHRPPASTEGAVPDLALHLSRRHLLGWAGAGLAGLALAGCGDGGDDASSGAPAPGPTDDRGTSFDGRTISVALYAKNHASSPLFWQQFAPEGLTVEPQIFTSGSDMNRAMDAGDLDFGLMGPYNTLIEAEQGFRSKIICMCSREGIGLAARVDRGIETVEDLAGKRVAVPPPGVQVLVLTTLLAEAGLELDRDVTAVPLGYADHAAALERGDVDAYMGTEPPVTQSVVDGVARRLDVYTTPVGDFNTAMWAAPHVQDDGELLAAVVRMQRDAAEHLTPGGENDEEVWHDLLVGQFGYAEDVAREVLSNIGAEWEFDDRRKSQVEGAGEIMLSTGVLNSKPDYESLYLLDYLPDR